MTRRQLDQVEQDYAGFVPAAWTVVQCENRFTSHSEDVAGIECAVCGGWLDPEGTHKRITWENRNTASKLALRYISALVCRNGVRCRARATASMGVAA